MLNLTRFDTKNGVIGKNRHQQHTEYLWKRVASDSAVFDSEECFVLDFASLPSEVAPHV